MKNEVLRKSLVASMGNYPRNVNKADSHLKFEAEKSSKNNTWTLRCRFGSPRDPWWNKTGISPVSCILSRCGIMERCGHKVQCIELIKAFWITDYEVGLIKKAMPHTFVRNLDENPEDSRIEFVQQGLFDLALPSFP